MSELESRVLEAVRAGMLNNDGVGMDTVIEDSLDHVEVILYIEEEFGIMIEDETAETLNTARLIVDHLEKRGVQA